MKIALIGSGSGGHIYPCIAFYQYATSQNHSCVCFLFKEIDKEIYKNKSIETIFVNTEYSNYKKYKYLTKHFKELEVDCVVTFGGKVSFISALAAKRCHLPLYICEQNIVFGKANRLSLLFANKVFLSLPIKENKKYIYCGNPVVENFHCQKAQLFSNHKPTILIVCGSLGSSSVIKKMKEFAQNETKLNFIFILGKNNTLSFDEQENIKVLPYYEPLRDLIYSCDLMISRAGATTISEIIAANKPTILIPSPYVANNHQYKNALFLKKKEGCLLIEEKNLNPTILKEYIYKVIYSHYETYRMKKRLIELQIKNPCQKMLAIIKENDDEK